MFCAQAQAIEARLGQNDSVVIPALQFFDSSIHIAAKFEHPQIASRMEQLRLPAQAARTDSRPCGQFLERKSPRWKAARRAHPRRLQTAAIVKPPGISVGTSFMLCTARVDASLEQSIFQFLDEHSLGAAFR